MSLPRIVLTAAVVSVFSFGCASDIAPDAASLLMKDLAVELAGTDSADSMPIVEKACEKHGVSVRSFASYINRNPKALEELSGYIQEEYAKKQAPELEAKKKEDFDRDFERAQKLQSDRIKSLESEKATLNNNLQKAEAELKELEHNFEKEKAELEAEIARLQAPAQP